MAIYVSASLLDVWFFMPSIVQPATLTATLLSAYLLTKIGLKKTNWGWKRDFGAKYLVVFALTLGILFSQGHGADRILAAFKINLYSSISQAKISSWLAPPSYTLASHTNLANGRSYDDLSKDIQNLSVTEGSIIKFSIEGGIRKPRLYLNEKQISFPPPHDNTFQQTVTLYKTGKLELNFGGNNKIVWDINVERDEAPTVGFISAPKSQSNHLLEVGYLAHDDFPIRKITLQFRKAGQYIDASETQEKEGQIFSHPLPIINENKVERYQSLDLSANPWAGTMVQGWLNVEDAIGQVRTSEVLQFRLPQRLFSSSVARNIINIRKSILIEPTPKEVLGQRLKLISENKEDINNDYVVYMALRTAYWRLNLSTSYDVNVIASLLWDAAVRLEETNTETFALYKQHDQ